MGHVIAVAGKGGVGKTTLCGLLIQYLCQSGKKPVLAVDADANSNLNEVLGVEIGQTLGELREEIERAGSDPKYEIPKGITKADWLETRLMDAVTEGDDFDLMVMGRSQGQGCYCFVNGLVQTQVQKLQSHYPYIVVDNEAGMEHVSRGILPQMEKVLLVSDCSRRGVQAAGLGNVHVNTPPLWSFFSICSETVQPAGIADCISGEDQYDMSCEKNQQYVHKKFS